MASADTGVGLAWVLGHLGVKHKSGVGHAGFSRSPHVADEERESRGGQQVRCSAADVNKTTIPFSLSDKVRGLGVQSGARAGGCGRPLPSSSFQWLPGPRGRPQPTA